MVQAPAAWAAGATGEGVVVAILDTGCFLDHPDLRSQIIGRKNFTAEGGADDVTDGNGHGTHVSGTIAAVKNGEGVVGVAPGAKLLICKVLDSEGRGGYDGLLAALAYVRDWRGVNGEKVSIASMSLGGPVDSPLLHASIQSTVAAGILVVCAAGNDGDDQAATDEYAYPGSYPEVVSVGACDGFGHVAPFSDSNTQIDLVAPGVGVQSTYNDGDYAVMSGTSMATPHVSGGAALIVQQWRQDHGADPTEGELFAELVKRTTTLDADPKLQGAGMLHIMDGYTPPAEYETITIEQAVAILAAEGVIDTPAFWLNLVGKFNADPVKYSDFRYVELLIRKVAAAIN
jgi:major intracellular serine protease